MDMERASCSQGRKAPRPVREWEVSEYAQSQNVEAPSGAEA